VISSTVYAFMFMHNADQKMTVFILSFIIITAGVLGLSLGLLFGRGQIKGSCGATEDLPGFGAGEGCSGACASRRDPQSDCQDRHSCRRQRETS
jgi:hypothetical protein